MLQQKGYAHEATEFIAYLEEKSRHEEINFDWCAGPSGELKIAMWSTPEAKNVLAQGVGSTLSAWMESMVRPTFQELSWFSQPLTTSTAFR